MKKLLLAVLFLVGVGLAVGALVTPSDPWAWFERASTQMAELPARIGEARRAGDSDLETRLINRYNDSADLYNTRMRAAMLEYGSPPPGFVIQYSHWFNLPIPPACCDGLFRPNRAEAADGELRTPGGSPVADAIWVAIILILAVILYRWPGLIWLLLIAAVGAGIIGLATRGPEQANTLRMVAVGLMIVAAVALVGVSLRALQGDGSADETGGKFHTLAVQIEAVAQELGAGGIYRKGGLAVGQGQIVYRGRVVADVGSFLFIPGDWQEVFASAVSAASVRRQIRAGAALVAQDSAETWLAGRAGRGRD